MNTISYMGWLLVQAWDGLFYIWPVSTVLLALIVVTLAHTGLNREAALRRHFWYGLLPLGGILSILLAGAICAENPAMTIWPDMGMVFTLLLAGAALYKSKDIWPLSASLCSFLVWFSFWCWFVAVMSITGDWM
jgi:hypothetical protein